MTYGIPPKWKRHMPLFKVGFYFYIFLGVTVDCTKPLTPSCHTLIHLISRSIPKALKKKKKEEWQFPSAEPSPTNFKNTSVILQTAEVSRTYHTPKLLKPHIEAGTRGQCAQPSWPSNPRTRKVYAKAYLETGKRGQCGKKSFQTLLEGINRQWKRIIRLNRQWNDVYHCAIVFWSFPISNLAFS